MKKNGEYDPPKYGSLKKTCRIMKATLLFLMLTVCHSFGMVYSQEVRLDIDLENATFGQFMEQVKDQSDFTFFFHDAMVMKLTNITLHVKQEDIDAILTKCLKGSGITYRIKDRTIILYGTDDNTKKEIEVKGRVVDEKGEPLPGATVKVKDEPGEKGVLRGTVTGPDGNFSLKVPNNKAVLEISFVGYVSQTIPVANAEALKKIVLKEVVENIDEVIVTGYQRIDRKLFTGAAAVIKAEDAMVEGSIDVSRMLQGKAAGVQIQNVSGTFGASPKMRVRGASSIYGNQKPLWVVDGLVLEDIVEISADDLSSGNSETLISSAIAGLNADDIESFQILKDASATALYGARAMNGVVVITTKKGKKGTMTVNYSGEFTIRMKPSYSQFNLMNSQEQMMVYEEMEEKGWLNYADISRDKNGGVYKKMADLISTYDPATGKFGLENTPQAKAAFLQKYEMANTDWFDVLFRNSLQQVHSLSLSSGSERSRFYASLSYFNDAGWTLADKVNRYTANMNASFDIKPWISVNLLTTNSLRMQKAPGTNSRRTNAVDGTFERDFDINPFSYALNTSRTLRPYDDNGNYEYYTMNYAPFSILNELNTNKLNIDMLDAKFQAELEIRPLKGLEVKALGAVRYVKTTREHRINDKSNAAEAYRADMDAQIRDNNKFLYKDPDNPGYPAKVVMPKGGFYNRDENTMLNYYQRGILNYNTSFNEGIHTLNVMAGEEVRYTNRTIAFNKGFGYQWDRGGVPFLDPDLLKQQIENGVDYYGMEEEYDRFAAFFGTVGYSYNGTYIFNVTGRYDGSNKLGKSRSARWLPTWNVSGAWHVTNEKFMGPVETISRLTLRATYGLTASMGPSSNSIAVLYNDVAYRPNQSDRENLIYISSLENSELTWEKQYETNVGIDLGIFDNRISLSADVYWRKGFDLIGNVRTSGIGGQQTKKANYANMKSNGVEFTLNTKNLVYSNFSWTTNLTFAFNKNKITKLESRPRVIDLVQAEGAPLKGYPVRGIFSIPFLGLNAEGMPILMDADGQPCTGDIDFQETINLGFLKYEGPVDPKITGGFENTFKYRNWTFSFFINYQFGNKVRLYDYFKSEYSDMTVMPKEFDDRWVLSGDETKTNIPVILSQRQVQRPKNEYKEAYNAYNFSTERIADGSFIRLKDISLTYKLPDRWMKTIGLGSASLKCIASNVALLYKDKKLHGQDPEFFRSGGVAMPVPRQITFSLRVGF